MKQSNNEAMSSVHFESLYPDNFRDDEIGKLTNFVKQGQSCQIIGLPGVGRSNLLRSLSFNRSIRLHHLGENQKWFHFVLVDFSEIKKRPLADATKFIFLSLIDSLRERKMINEYEKINQLFRESLLYSSSEPLRHPREDGDPINKQKNVDSRTTRVLSSSKGRLRGNDIRSENDRINHQLINDEMVLFQGLKKAIDFLALEKELTIVLLFDRFEEYIPSVTDTFFANLKVLRNRAKYRFSVVFSLKRPLEDILEPTLFSEFYEFLIEHEIYLNLFDKAGTDFRIAYLERITGKKISPGIIKNILELTSGHGKLTRLAIETILAQNVILSKAKNLDPSVATLPQDDIKMFLLNQKAIIGSFIEIWSFLTPSEQKIIYEILKPPKGISHFMAAQVQNDNKNENFTFLEKVGLIKNKKITISLLEAFIKDTLSTMKQFNNETIALDENTNEIKKGEIVLSEQLTAAEYKLLNFLISNKDKILNREEIINAVWKDSKTTLGVTDQALDQLIFRLRKKIEEDPNNPTHIQTIKGRGIRFTA